MVPSYFHAPQFLRRDSIGLNTVAEESSAGLTVYYYVANPQNGAIDISGHREGNSFVCVW